jgi:hypothetical protein
VVTASVENARSDPWQVLLEEAAQYGKRLERRNLAVYLDPEIRFLLSVVQRKRGYPGDTKRYLIERSRRGDDAWARCAAAELWLLEPEKDALPIDRRECPKPILHAYYTPERPILDGRFDDDAWKKGQAVSLRHGSLLSDPTARRTRYRDPRGIPSSMNWNARRDIFRGQTPENDRPPSLLPDKVRNSPKPPSASPGPNTSVPSRTDPPPSPAESFPSAEDMLSGAIGSEPQLEDPYQTEVRFAYDHEFLYVAVRFRGGASEPLEESSRPRDPDLSNRDRVEIRLDLDRDYQTAYRFTLDRRGWGAESCWNTTSWNPTWYIARAEEGGFRRIEAAIPLEELADSFPQSRTVWALSLTRIVPGAGFRSWTEIDHLQETPDRYGYLLFH